MTSTGFNVGLAHEKNSSRVLRPPGGGHSDIFGTRDNDNGLVTPSKRRNQPQSTIGGCFSMLEEKLSSPTAEKEEIASNGIEAQNGQEKNEIENETDENKAPSEQEEKEAKNEQEAENPIPKRVRVPPGGFSSALW